MRGTLPGLALILLAGFVVRLALILCLRDLGTGPVGGPTADDVEFEVLARNLAHGEGFTNSHGALTSFRAPGWPLFLAGLYRVFGEHPPLVYLANCVLGALACGLAWGLGRELFGAQGGWWAGWLCAGFLPHAWFATLYYSENLFVPLLGGAALLLVQHSRRADLGGVTLAGCLLGAAILTRPFALLLVPLWGVWLLCQRPGIGRPGLQRLLDAFVLGAVALAIVAPWTWRNWKVHGRPVLVATNGGSTFYGGNNSVVAGDWKKWGNWLSTVELPDRDRIEATPDEVSHDAMEWQLGTEWVKSHPGQALLLVPAKLLRTVFWLPDFDGGRWSLSVRVLCWLPYLILLVLGIRQLGQMRGVWWVIHLAMLATTITAVIFWGSPRFRDANAPLLVLYATAAFVSPRREN